MKVLVIGANGKTGRRVVETLKAGSHEPLALIRSPAQKDSFDAMGVPTVLGDLEYPIDHAVRGCDAVIFAAGSGSKTGKDKTVLVDHVGAIRSMVTAAVNGARRYVMLSSFRADVASESPIKHYHRAKGAADDFLRSIHEVLPEPLDWTIICPGGLTEDAGSGRVAVSLQTAQEPDGSSKTSRDNLAAALAACLDEPATVGKTFTLFEGETPLREALRSL